MACGQTLRGESVGKTTRGGVARGLAAALAVVAVSLAGLQTPIVGQAASFNPCDNAPLPICTTALGPLRDVTANWRSYQPSLVQPIPIADYCPNPPSCSSGDPEDSPQPAGAGYCGTETYTPPPALTPSTTSTIETSLHGYPPPPRNVAGATDYCFLRYLPNPNGDFDLLCSGCHRILIDFSAMPNLAGATVRGHWASRMTIGDDMTETTPFNAHSPNIKNLCADKFFNTTALTPSPGATCNIQAISNFDLRAHSYEGDSTYYHHYPLEGRYFNGPAYLAGDGVTVPYHWVNGAYFDIDPMGSATASPVWYGAGYRPLSCPLPDTDQSYGSACEAPAPVGQPLPDKCAPLPLPPQDCPPLPEVSLGDQTISTDLQLAQLPGTGPGSGSGATGNPAANNGAGSGLPNTSVGTQSVYAGVLSLAIGAAVVAAAAIVEARRRRSRWR